SYQIISKVPLYTFSFITAAHNVRHDSYHQHCCRIPTYPVSDINETSADPDTSPGTHIANPNSHPLPAVLCQCPPLVLLNPQCLSAAEAATSNGSSYRRDSPRTACTRARTRRGAGQQQQVSKGTQGILR